jgi:hypothetical protein
MQLACCEGIYVQRVLACLLLVPCPDGEKEKKREVDGARTDGIPRHSTDGDSFKRFGDCICVGILWS